MGLLTPALRCRSCRIPSPPPSEKMHSLGPCLDAQEHVNDLGNSEVGKGADFNWTVTAQPGALQLPTSLTFDHHHRATGSLDGRPAVCERDFTRRFQSDATPASGSARKWKSQVTRVSTLHHCKSSRAGARLRSTQPPYRTTLRAMTFHSGHRLQ